MCENELPFKSNIRMLFLKINICDSMYWHVCDIMFSILLLYSLDLESVNKIYYILLYETLKKTDIYQRLS